MGGLWTAWGGGLGGRVVNICNFENKIELGFWTTLSVETHFWTPHKIACNLTWAGRGEGQGLRGALWGGPFWEMSCNYFGLYFRSREDHKIEI